MNQLVMRQKKFLKKKSSKKKKKQKSKGDKKTYEIPTESDISNCNDSSNSFEEKKSQSSLEMNESFQNKDNFEMIQIKDFIKYVPSWGGRFVDNGKQTRFKLINTCTIDYFLLGFWYASKIKSSFINELEQSNLELNLKLINIINLIDNNDWSEAKSIWIKDVVKLNINNDGFFSTFGDQTDFSDSLVVEHQSYESFAKCRCGRKHTSGGQMISFVKDESEITISLIKNNCNRCDKMNNLETKFLIGNNNPLFLVVENSSKLDILCSDLDEIQINGSVYFF